MGEKLNDFPSDEEFREQGFVSRDWHSNEVDEMVKFYFPPVSSTVSVFSWYKKNRLGAESDFLVFVGPDKDGETKQKIHLMIKGIPIKDESSIFKKAPNVDYTFLKLDEWAKDAPLEIKKEAKDKLRELFAYQLRVPDLSKARTFSVGAKIKGFPVEVGAKYQQEKKEKMKGKN